MCSLIHSIIWFDNSKDLLNDIKHVFPELLSISVYLLIIYLLVLSFLHHCISFITICLFLTLVFVQFFTIDKPTTRLNYNMLKAVQYNNSFIRYAM